MHTCAVRHRIYLSNISHWTSRLGNIEMAQIEIETSHWESSICVHMAAQCSQSRSCQCKWLQHWSCQQTCANPKEATCVFILQADGTVKCYTEHNISKMSFLYCREEGFTWRPVSMWTHNRAWLRLNQQSQTKQNNWVGPTQCTHAGRH